jgi:hypothetical protein
VQFLCTAHKGFDGYTSRAKPTYEDPALQTYIDYIDELHESVSIFESNYNASEVLYYTDYEAFKEYQREFTSSVRESE